MKKIKVILVAAVIFILAVFFLNKAIIVYFAKQKISSALPGSRVSIGKCIFNPKHDVAFYDLKVKHKDYDFAIKQLKIEYILRELLHGSISTVFLEDALVDIHAKDKNVQGLIQDFKAGSSKGFLVDKLELPGAKIKIKTSDLSAEASLSGTFDLKKQSPAGIDFKVDLLEMPGLQLNDLVFRGISSDGRIYNLNIGSMEYNKARLNNIYGKISLNGKRMVVSPLFAHTLGGKIFINAEFILDKTVIYSINLEAQDLNMQNLVDEFKLTEKLAMTGKLSGRASLQGGGADVYVLRGNLSLPNPGGILVIKDKGMLENIARESQQPFDTVMEGFKDYKYDTGILTLSLDNHDLGLVMLLDGKAGKRSVNIVWHNFKIFEDIM